MKKWRIACAVISALALVPMITRIPLWLSMSSNGEISVIHMFCLLAGLIAMVVGIVRYVLAATPSGVPFVIATCAWGIALLSMHMAVAILSIWSVEAALVSAFSAVIGFLPDPGSKVPRAEDAYPK